MIGCIPPMIKENNDSSTIKCTGKKKDMDHYVKASQFNKIKTKCKKSCTELAYNSALLREYKSSFYGTSILIYVDSTVTEGKSNFTETPFRILEALGSSLGLWLGLGIIQVAEQLWKLMSKVKAIYHDV